MPSVDNALDAIQNARQYLPPDLANWRRTEMRDTRHPLTAVEQAVAKGTIAGSYAATSGDRFVVVILGVERDHRVRARDAMTLQVRDPRSGDVVRHFDLEKGGAIPLTRNKAWILTGQRR
jgi:hypothetical protein